MAFGTSRLGSPEVPDKADDVPLAVTHREREREREREERSLSGCYLFACSNSLTEANSIVC
jgi:hypothetical protein